MKFSPYTWSLYTSSDVGKATIALFDPETGEDCYEAAVKFNPQLNFLAKTDFAMICDDVFSSAYDSDIESFDDAKQVYMEIIDLGIRIEGCQTLLPKDYEVALQLTAPVSFGLYVRCKEYYFPNFFQYNAYALKNLADYFEMELPSYPKKSDYRARCMYYWELCEMFYRFRCENGLSPEELCAFIYDFAPNVIQTDKNDNLPRPANAWFIGGVLPEADKTPDKINSWQSNVATKRGDILIHYETAPVSAITAMWIATTDGIIDPFFHWYSWVYMGQYQSLPPISLKDLQADNYFSKHPLVRKKFQGVNGWQITGQDYNELLRLIRSKRGAVDNLPKLYAPPAPIALNIEKERDVETQLLEYYLNKMGYVENRDYRRQLSIHAGRGHRIFPDYALHYDDTPDYETAKVLIEAKLEIRNNIQLEECFKQAYSYAKLLESSVIVLCDKHGLFVYEKHESFDRTRYTRFYWGELETPDTYNMLKSKLQ